MRMILFTQFFYPEHIAAAFRAYENAIAWSKTGNEVSIFTCYPNYPTGHIFQGYHNCLFSTEKIDKIYIIRNKLKVAKNTSMIKRIVNALSFPIFSLANIYLHNKEIDRRGYDIAIGSTGPIFTAMLGYFYAHKKHIPFIFEIRDITYKQLVATGSNETSWKVRLMKSWELSLCRKAARVVVLTNGFKDILVRDGIDSSKIHVITNGVDISEPVEIEQSNSLRFGYFGTIGISQDVPLSVEYVSHLKENLTAGLEYLIIGDGAKSYDVSMLAKTQYQFVHVMPGMSAEELERYYSKIDAGVVILRKSDNFKDTLPSKLFQIMGRGIPVIFIGPDGEAAKLIRNYKAGIVLSGNKESDVNTLIDFFRTADWRDKLKVLGQNGHIAVKENFSRTELAKKYLDIMAGVIGHD